MKVRIALLTFLLALVVGAPGVLWAKSTYQTTFNKKYGTAATPLGKCNVCHATVSGSGYNKYGTAVRTQLGRGKPIARALRAVQRRDSDVDGYTNIREIRARTFPGNAASKPAGPVAPAALGAEVEARATAVNTYSQEEYTFLAFDQLGPDIYRYVRIKADQVDIGQTDGFPDENGVDMGSMEVSIPLGAWNTVQAEVMSTSTVNIYVDGSPEPFASYGF